MATFFARLSAAMALVTRWSAQQVERPKREQTELARMLEEITRDAALGRANSRRWLTES